MILVTGGTGFLGSHLLLNLTMTGSKIRATRRNSSSLDLARRVFDLYSPDAERQFDLIEWIEADLLDIFSMENALQGITQVYHCAGEISFRKSKRSYLSANNSTATGNLVNLCLMLPQVRVGHVSSIAAIGRSRLDDRISEERFWKNDPNNSWYAISKYNAEREIWRGIEEGLDAFIINPSVIIGYTNWHEGSGKLFQDVWKGLRYYTEGVTGWVGVEDVVKSLRVLMDSSVRGERFIVSAENHTYHEVLRMIAQALGKKIPDRKASPVLSELAWRLEAIRAKISASDPLITRETAKTAQLKCFYDNQKLIDQFGISYQPISEVITKTAGLFLKETRKSNVPV